ncbi:MAG: putative hydrolase [Candidatus Saccharibacteria bacterium]|nr:putative hydrolase [Candidatus Saccharibacteria bacterium]
MEDELLDLVNNKDEVIGTILRSSYEKMVAEKLGYIRAVEMFIQNDEGKLWIPTRTAHKKIAPNGLDYSMGGHVSSSESYVESALREIQEELNLDLQEDDLEFIKKFAPTNLPYFRCLYVYHSNEAPAYNPDDYVSAAWLTPQEIIASIDSGTPAKSSLRETVLALQASKPA